MQVNFNAGLVPAVTITFLCLLFALFQLVHHYPERFAFTRYIRKNKIGLGLGFLGFILIVVILMPIIFVPIPYGHSAVVWARFQGGTQLHEHFDEGTLLVMPWNRVYIYSTQYQVLEHEFQAATKNGLSIGINTVVRYRIRHDALAHLHVNVGEDYVNRLILPEIGARARIELARYSAEEVYATKRLFIQDTIWKELAGDLDVKIPPHKDTDNHSESGRIKEKCQKNQDGVDIHCTISDYLELQEFLIRDIILPEGISAAIVRKIEKVYLNAEYDTLIQIAGKEALRKREEATGIAGFQSIVTGGISETYLRWRGIEATLELAKSNNTKVVVIGGGKDGLPIILNTESAVTTPPLIDIKDPNQLSSANKSIANKGVPADAALQQATQQMQGILDKMNKAGVAQTKSDDPPRVGNEQVKQFD